jgi:hypothetical protein
LAKHSRFCHTCCFRIWGSSSHHLACLPQFSIYLCSKTWQLKPPITNIHCPLIQEENRENS